MGRSVRPAPGGLTDLHSHILPGLDDGASSLDEAVDIASEAATAGVCRIVATPHTYAYRLRGERASPLVARVEEGVAALREALGRAGVEIEVLPGAECYLEPDLMPALQQGGALTIADTHYLLVELPPLEVPRYVRQLVFDLQVRGYRLILAHPERNEGILRSPGLLAGLSELGVLAQVTAASLVGEFGSPVKQAALQFLKRGLAQIIATDVHGAGVRDTPLSEGAGAAAREIGEIAWQMVTRVPDLILADEPVEAVRQQIEAAR